MIRKTKTQKSGIYQIKSKIKDRCYIGSACDINRRKNKEHYKDLMNNRHYNKKLQYHVNKYGIDDLVFEVLEICDKSKLLEREQFYIDKINPFFNINPKAESRLGAKLTEKQKKQFQGSNNPMYGVHKYGKDAPAYGKRWKLTEEQKDKHRGVNNPGFGKPSPLKGLTKYTCDSIMKQSESMKGNTFNKGRKLTEEHKEKTRQSMKRWYETEAGILFKKNATGSNNPNFGKPKSKETREKMSIGMLKSKKLKKQARIYEGLFSIPFIK